MDIRSAMGDAGSEVSYHVSKPDLKKMWHGAIFTRVKPTAPCIFHWWLIPSHTVHSSSIAINNLLIDRRTGIYSALFVQSVQVLLKWRRTHYKLHLCCLTALFLLSTIHIVAAYAWAFITDTATTAIYEVLSLRNPPPDLYGPDDPIVVHHLARLLRALYAIANVLADAILIWRCYVIWGNSWRAVAFPCVAYLVNIGGIIVGALPLLGPSERTAIAVCIGTTFLTNMVASSLAAGRIWWISRRASFIISPTSRRTYANLTAILLESGCIYPISLILILFVHRPPSSTISVLISIAPVYHIVGISPTLIIVRVGLGVSTDNVDKVLTSVSHDPNDLEHTHTRRLSISRLRFNHATTVELGLETRRRTNDLDENDVNDSVGTGIVDSRSDTTKV
ncbi:Ras-GEF domain-containing protein [Mycena venus]|uniref:Ras-GEF domain-containing protein n=1 Tax=Mycena venus TaxID=2733690 RepID=A0A8H7CG61_9AGAR|nr:Ras-GEF domain-containing protein [Mycena venus]